MDKQIEERIVGLAQEIDDVLRREFGKRPIPDMLVALGMILVAACDQGKINPLDVIQVSAITLLRAGLVKDFRDPNEPTH